MIYFFGSMLFHEWGINLCTENSQVRIQVRFSFVQLTRVSIQEVKSLWVDHVVFPRLGTGDTDREDSKYRWKLDFWSSIQQKGSIIGHFGARDDQNIMTRKFFGKIGLSKLLRPVRLQTLLSSMRLERFQEPGKSPRRIFESSRFLNSITWWLILLYFNVLKKHKI